MEVVMREEEIIAATVHWLERAVIGLNLCPFAKAVHVKKQIRYVVSAATTPDALREDLIRELELLVHTPAKQLDTTLLIHPFVLSDFLDFNDFLHRANATLLKLNLSGQFQIASFHPFYQFAGTQADDIDNYTNRSPYPTLHLLREASMTQAVAAFPDASMIFEKNIATLHQLGHAGWEALGMKTNRFEV
jgi:uncharacterized protein